MGVTWNNKALKLQPQSNEASGQTAKKNKKTILIAEDNDAIAVATTMVLQSEDYEVLVANNGGQVIEMAITYHPDLILMDIKMPGIDGLGAIKTIRETPAISGTPIIAVTGRATTNDKTKCLQAGADQYLRKPYPVADLVQLINELCTG